MLEAVNKMPVINEKMRIAGEKVDGDTGSVVEVFNPYNGELVGTVPRASREQVVNAFEIAASYKPTLTRYERQQILSRTAELLVARKALQNVEFARKTACTKSDVHSTYSAFPVNCVSMTMGRYFRVI
jgi:acyl-CoA reductase-like NAD-dependent aldehyde dehydrogenase